MSLQKLGRNNVRHDKKYFYQLLDGLNLVLVVDVHEGVDDIKNLGKVVLQLEK